MLLLQMNNQSRVYQVYFSKDIKKKKKVYSDGFLLCTGKKSKLFNAEGQCLLVVNNKQQPQPQEEYTLNNLYIVVIEKEISYQDYISGKIFLAQQAQILPPVKKIVKKKESLHKIQLDVAKVFQNGLRIESFIFEHLRPHQVEGVKFMYECISGQKGKQIQGCILADFMGLGKTLQTLTLIRCAVIQKIASKIVVVCPLTLLKVWERECIKWMGNKLNPLVSLGSSEQITKIIRMFIDYDYRFLIVSYQNFYKNSQALSKKCELLIFDEGHRLKNKKSKFFKKIQSFKCKKRILLTGTPLQNNLNELYTCIAIVNPFFFESQQVFKNVFQKPIIAGMAKNSTEQQRALALNRTSELASRIKQFSLRRKANVLEQYLPKKRQYQIFLKLSPLQQILYDRIKKKKMTQSDVLSFINVMRKLFVHPILFKNDRFKNEQLKDCLEDCRDQTSPKIQFIRKIALNCKEQNQKLIIVSYFTETLDFVQQIIQNQGLTVAKLDGRVDGQDRFRIIEGFFSKKDVLLLSGKAGGTGLTLTCACKMIMIEPDWNPSNDSQVMGRVWRQGQTKQVQIFRLIVGCSFQEKILQRQQLKQSLSEKLIDQSKNNQSYDFFSLRQLFMEIAPKCITYNENSNRLKDCSKQLNHIDWDNVVHVQVLETHNDEDKKIVNEFQEADFEAIQQQQEKDEDEFNIDEVDNYETIRELQQSKQQQPIKVIIQQQQQTKPQIKQQAFEKVAQERKQQIRESIEQYKSEKKSKQQQNVFTEKVEQLEVPCLPLAARKFKKKLN